MVGGLGMIGGLTPADSNRIFGDYGLQLGGGSSGGRLQVRNNNIFARSACVEMTFLRQGFRHTIANNKLQPMDTQIHSSLVEIKNNTSSANPPFIDIFENQFLNFYRFGVATTRSRRVSIFNNTFIPLADSTNYAHVLINTKQKTSGADLPTTVETTISGNDFRDNGISGGTGIVVYNHNSNANPAFTQTTLGGDGALANRFGRNIRTIFFLDTASGPSNNNAFWTNSPVTTMKPVDENFNLVENLFDMGSGFKRPSELSNLELLALEDKIVHKIETGILGLVTVKPNHVFITPNSFLTPFTTSPSVQRAVDAIGANDNFTLNMAAATYTGTTTVSQSAVFDVAPATSATLGSLEMNGVGKTLSLNAPIRLAGDLTLTSGVVDLQNSNLTIEPGVAVIGGNLAAHVRAVGDGYFVHAQLGGGTKRYPIGTLTRYSEVELSNLGTTDDVGLKVRDDVLSAGLTGTPVDSVVGITYQIQELVAGGSNLRFSPKWAAADEKPNYDRALNTIEQFNSGNWQTISSLPVPAVGNDPYTLTSNINGSWSGQAVRIKGQSEIAGRLHYVANTGDDSRTPTQAKNPNTPWRTIANAIAQTMSGDSIQVFAGTYPEHDLNVNKTLTLLGNVIGVGTGVGAGTGVRPIVNGTSPTSTDTAIFLLRAPNINIRNFNIKVDQENISIGIDAPRSGFTGLVIEDNLIESTGDIVGNNDVKVMSHAILLGRLLGSGNPPPSANDSVIVRRNIINREGPTKKWFSRGIRFWGGRGMVGGYDAADGNEVHADFAIQLATGSTGGRLQVVNNTVFGRAAGIELNTPARTFRHTIFRNTLRPLDLKEHFALIEIKSNIGTVGPPGPSIAPFIDIEENQLLDFYHIGVALTRSRNCIVKNNVFTPLADSTRYIHVWVSHKQRTSGTAASQPPLTTIETTIQGNTFNGNNVFGGYGLAYQNSNTNTGDPVFTVSNIGGAGALANMFGANIATVMYLDTVTGPSSRNPFWSNPGINWTVWPSTNMAPVRDNFDLTENMFDLGTGSKRPAAMSNAELYELEDKIQHKIDADVLGFVTVKPAEAYVTNNSFLTPLTSAPSVQRGVDAADADDWTLFIQPNFIPEVVRIDKSITFNASPAPVASLNGIIMDGSLKVLTLADTIRLRQSLVVSNPSGGKISIGTNNLVLESAATSTLGNVDSYVIADTSGNLVKEGITDQPFTFAIGTASDYAPVEFDDVNNTGDRIGMGVRPAAVQTSFTPDLPVGITNYVNLQWRISETVVGGHNARLNFAWNQVNEINPPLNISTVIAREDGIGWSATTANYDNFDAEASGFSAFNSGFSVYADAAVTTITTENPDNNFYCAGATLSIPFTVNGLELTVGNVFTAQLSDPNGSFATFTVLPNPLIGVTTGVITTTLPTSLPFGTGYRIRVVSSTPVVTGSISNIDITINPVPVRPVISINGSTVFCIGESRTLTSSALTGNFWSPGGATTQEITVTSSGRYSVRVDSTNNCSAFSDTLDITVNPLPATATIGNTGPLTFCESGSVRLGTGVVGGNLWSTNETTDSITVSATTTITVQVVVNGCTSLVSNPIQVTVNPLPATPTIAALPVSGVACEGETVTLTSSAANNNLWSNGATTVSITVNTTGSFTVQAISAAGCTSAVSTPIPVTINPLPATPTITASGDLEFCEGGSVTLTSSVATGNVWSNGSTTQNITVSASGAFTVSQVGATGCSSATSTPVQVTVLPNPVAPSITSPAADVSICQGDSVALISSAANGNIWSNGETSNLILVRNAGTFTVRLVEQGCTSLASGSRTVSILPVPAIPTISPAGPVTVCEPEIVTLTATTGANFVWSNGATTNSIGVTESGRFTVRAVEAGCFSIESDTARVTINPKPAATVALQGSASFCDGSSVTLTGPSGAGLTYSWSNGSTEQTILVTTSSTIRLTVTNEFACVDTSAEVVTVNNPNPVVVISKDTAIKAGQVVDLNANATPISGTYSYAWTPDDGTITSGLNEVTASVRPLNTIVYTVEVEDQNGCIAIDSVLVRVGKGVYIPNMFSPNGDDKNPTFKVYGFGVKDIKLLVFNRLGQLVFETDKTGEIVETSTNSNSVPGWDGKFKDKDLPADTYTWIISGTFTTGEEIKDTDGKNSGSVTIIR